LAGESISIEDGAHLAFDPRHFAQAELVDFIWLERGGCVVAQKIRGSVEKLLVLFVVMYK